MQCAPFGNPCGSCNKGQVCSQIENCAFMCITSLDGAGSWVKDAGEDEYRTLLPWAGFLEGIGVVLIVLIGLLWKKTGTYEVGVSRETLPTVPPPPPPPPRQPRSIASPEEVKAHVMSPAIASSVSPVASIEAMSPTLTPKDLHIDFANTEPTPHSPDQLLDTPLSCGFSVEIDSKRLAGLYGVSKTNAEFTCYCHHFTQDGAHCTVTQTDSKASRACPGVLYARKSSAAFNFLGISNLILECRPKKDGHTRCTDKHCPYLAEGVACPYTV
eukprot:TRINITY_DN4826_c0_g1_i1.p1 TRINITY_DN4826_c0_g1~~TRINITY_DN4826_c0_g1_i1.p1  ORF type:complete len:271 (+),score=30.57 TRINITY_DN4826_c0_g1_i1:48-860(+)